MIRLWAVTMAKDEGDVIDHTLYHLSAEGVEGIVVADNLSSDDTHDRLLEAQERLSGKTEVIIKIDEEVAYTQDHKMTMMARDVGIHKRADWIIPFDADELWFSRSGTLQEVLTKADQEGFLTAKPLYTNHSVTAFDKIADNPYEAMIYKWDQPTNYKTCFKFRPDISISNGNHFVYWQDPHEGHMRDEKPLLDTVEIRHFQYRGEEHFIRKILNAYTACKALPDNADLRGGAAWKEQFIAYETGGIDALRQFYYDNIYVTELGTLIEDPAPYKGGVYA